MADKVHSSLPWKSSVSIFICSKHLVSCLDEMVNIGLD
ncbi:hypothetical protein SynROS8604_00807 [Synechococcus sp. ROS8604]|nr:hypothetical protein SynROS8604_00807 [Synechococcus sp. ROS8604]